MGRLLAALVGRLASSANWLGVGPLDAASQAKGGGEK